MDAAAVSTTQQSIEAINEVMKRASAESIEAASKMVKVSTEMKVAPATGNGGNIIDTYA